VTPSTHCYDVLANNFTQILLLSLAKVVSERHQRKHTN